MKRDMELIRKILITAQNGNLQGQIDGYSDDEIKYNKALAIEKGLLKGSVAQDHSKLTDIPGAVLTKGITWEGHDFIDAIESDSNWNKVKSYLKEAGKIVTIESVQLAVHQLFVSN